MTVVSDRATPQGSLHYGVTFSVTHCVSKRKNINQCEVEQLQTAEPVYAD